MVIVAYKNSVCVIFLATIVKHGPYCTSLGANSCVEFLRAASGKGKIHLEVKVSAGQHDSEIVR